MERLFAIEITVTQNVAIGPATARGSPATATPAPSTTWAWGYECHTGPDGTVSPRYHIYADNNLVATHISTDDHKTHQVRYNTEWQVPDNNQTQSNPYTSQGFTGHEHIPALGLIHMNGRVSDPEVGRFLSTDPFIQAPDNSQSYNRYSYVLNNPLRYVDPSGYFWKKMRNSISRNWNRFTRTVSQFVGNNSNSNRSGSSAITWQEAQRYFSGTHQSSGQALTVVENVHNSSDPGKWLITGVNKRGIRNIFQMLAKRTETISEKGRLWGSDGKDFEGTIQDVTQTWAALTTNETQALAEQGLVSVARTYGDTRVITQTYLESHDAWNINGKSWYWQPIVRRE
jgi:RHS repeat-associated protein